jgi:hypothetical protein
MYVYHYKRQLFRHGSSSVKTIALLIAGSTGYYTWYVSSTYTIASDYYIKIQDFQDNHIGVSSFTSLLYLKFVSFQYHAISASCLFVGNG